jgi:glyceraldehyde-3-phosphate dehydrogenase/erythrose-4-phosphate dehydrogenase
VPVKTGSVTELVAILGKKVTVEEINAALKKATQEINRSVIPMKRLCRQM